MISRRYGWLLLVHWPLLAHGLIENAPSAPVSSRPSATDLRDGLSGLERCKSGAQARNLLNNVLLRNNDGKNALYGSLTIPQGASSVTLRDGDLAVQTGIRLEDGISSSESSALGIPSRLVELNGQRDMDRVSAFLVLAFVPPLAAATGLDYFLLPAGSPEILRWILNWALAFSPLLYAGAGLAFPAKLQAALVNAQAALMPSYRRRMVEHEAGHFLIGHLLGWPVKGYSANAVRNAVEFYPLADPRAGSDRAGLLGFDVAGADEEDYGDVRAPPAVNTEPFYSEAGRGADAMVQQSVFRDPSPVGPAPPGEGDDPVSVWPYRGFDHETLDMLSAVSMGGICSELIGFGRAEGGYADVAQLSSLLGAATPELDAREKANRVRYSISFGVTQLRRHGAAMDALVDVMARGGGVAECVAAIETSEGIAPRLTSRREDESEFERILLYLGGILGQVAGDDQSKRMKRIEGEGGGDITPPEFEITGDDPLYIAGGLAFAFFVWASSGGLSLH